MNFPKKTLFASLLMVSATSAFAVDTTNLTVIGTIAPTACTPTFAGGGVVDYGNIPTASLSSTAETPLATRTVTYTISCDAPISIGTSWTDARSETSTGPVANFFGLGTHAGANIGHYSMFQNSASGGATGDGAPVDVIFRNSPTDAWAAPGAGAGTIVGNGVRVHSFAPTGTLIPGTYSTVTGSILLTAIIAPTNTLDLSSSVVLDGLSTITVRYL